MGCVNSHADVSRPNLFQRNLCVHHKEPVTNTYKVLGELGKGAFGIVEKVQHIKTGTFFAMKTVTFASGSKRSEFEKEIDILRGLHHSNIVRMLETFEDDHHFYIIMELCTGGTLLDKVKQRGCEFPEEEVKDVIAKLGSVIQYLHSRFICHRDLKLENILLDAEDQGGTVKLCDFGASTLFRMGVTMRKVLGSVVYMAPEVLEGNYTQACDLWSLGVIMYMLLSNTPPFYGASEDDLIEKIFEARVTFDGPVWESVSLEAKMLIKKLLNPDPTSRYTATQLLAHSWIKSSVHAVPPEVYDEFVPRVKAFCQYSPFQRAGLVAFAFCISSAKILNHSAVYNELNVAHNGILTLQELQQAPALKRFSLDMEKIYNALDQQHEKGVNLLEFVAATLSPEDVANDELLRKTFQIFDRNHSGGITHQDLLALLGQHFDLAACQDMIKRADSDKDGKIGYEDFAKMLKLPSRLFSPRSRCGRGPREAASKSSPPKPIVTRHSVVARSNSSVQIDTETATRLEKRRRSSPMSKLQSTASRTDSDHHIAVEEISHASREEALLKIQALHKDIEHTNALRGTPEETKTDDVRVAMMAEDQQQPPDTYEADTKAIEIPAALAQVEVNA